MVDYRGPMGLIGVVLQAMRNGATVSEIMRRTRMPEDEARCYLKLLLERKLIEREASLEYRPTKEGMDCLRLFDAVGELCSFEPDLSRPEEVVSEGWLHRDCINDEFVERLRDIIGP